jgi:hypothetical protein
MPQQNQYPELTTPDATTFLTGYRTDPVTGDLDTVNIPASLATGNKLFTSSGYPTAAGVTNGDLNIDINSGDVYSWNYGAQTWGTPVMNLVNGQVTFAAWVSGNPAPSQKLISFEAINAVVLSNAASSVVASCGTAPTATAVFSLTKNGTQFGTVTFSAGVTSGVYSASSSTTFNDGDIFEVLAPASQDATLASVRITAVAAMASSLGASALLALALGPAQTLQNETSSRTAGSTYTNGETQPITCYVRGVASSANGSLEVLIAGIEVLLHAQATNGGPISSSFIVPPGATYEVIATNATISSWYEYR